MSVSHIVDLHHRGNGAAAEACYFFEGKNAFGVSVGVAFEFEVPPVSIINQHSTLYMACRTRTNFNHVQSHWPVPELAVEGGNAHDLSGCDISGFAHPLQGFLRQVVECLLNLLQDWNGVVLRSSMVADDLIGDILNFVVDDYLMVFIVGI